jgi:hypothetical protein
MNEAEFLALQSQLWAAFWPLPYIFLLMILVGGIFLAIGHVALNSILKLLERF